MSGAEKFLRDLIDPKQYIGPLPKGTREAIAEVLVERRTLLQAAAQADTHSSDVEPQR